jgi:hypothetical protein
MADHGPSEDVKGDREVEVGQAAHDLFAEVLRTLEDRREAVDLVAEALLTSPDGSLDGTRVEGLIKAESDLDSVRPE